MRRFVQRDGRRRFLGGGASLALAALIGLPACGDDVPPGAGGSGSTAADASSGGGGPQTGSSTAAEDTTAGDTGSVGDSTTEAEAESESSTGAELVVDVSVQTYASQPMVVDLVFSVPDLTVSVAHQNDPGVVAVVIPPEDRDTTQVRVRGLRPATQHPLSYLADDGSGDAVSGEVLVDTEPALPGFRASFPVMGDGPAPADYVLFDLLTFGEETPSSMFIVDAEGTTRWHHGVLDEVVGIPIIHAAATLQSDGSLLYVRGDTISVIDELGTPQVTLTAADLAQPGLHHEVLALDNGNFMSLSYAFQEIDYADIGPTWIAGDVIVEVTPQGDVVWEWDAFDHLDPQRRRDGFEEIIVDPATQLDTNDWTHGNGLVYDPATDVVLVSLRHQDWIVAIDRTTSEVLWRFGDEGDFTLTDGTWFYHQHSPQWQADGTLLLYDNGVGNPNVEDGLETSRAVRYSLDDQAMTAALLWEDEAEDFVSAIAGDANRLADDSILITDSALENGDGVLRGRLRKVDEASSAVPQWSLESSLGQLIYRAVSVDRLAGVARE
ncbi:MAG: aryl-sulfate sulfotransferase [Myxococcota bacterium]